MFDQGWLEVLLDIVGLALVLLLWPKRGSRRSQMTESPILQAALRWLVLMLGCDRVPPAASAPVGKAPTSLIYHIQWYRAAATPPQCLHALH